ncbi:hypothetical protein [Sulfitobacter mediterraneus]|uniref:hypothetical protein n=1 Tax=Sulfitobacter mediterraneus TaxID=83219 RepID=UPI00193A8223|nr:hypothetical protein [Sulfitobacter mediterraneus]MBM1570141.1 hypothetical protein [Sulfitobacter mediterraneus]MBM1577883.1 hypothetical protein [Sulfitobacter mediterraneus]MBM1587290.1 hypothetical protein [Sulfitobacter mediterraneus]MBM1594823.1 hypothetical protein [Sulfitobacter mediterraneus]MBM1602500.1 hypothetical protein [Sulfitobacter mediterraneus]
MEFWYFCQIAGAVMLGNAFSFAFFMGAMKCSKLQKNGVKDDELPWWVYLCLIVPLLFAGLASASLN